MFGKEWLNWLAPRPVHGVIGVDNPVRRLWPESDPEDGITVAEALKDLVDELKRQVGPRVETGRTLLPVSGRSPGHPTTPRRNVPAESRTWARRAGEAGDFPWSSDLAPHPQQRPADSSPGGALSLCWETVTTGDRFPAGGQARWTHSGRKNLSRVQREPTDRLVFPQVTAIHPPTTNGDPHAGSVPGLQTSPSAPDHPSRSSTVRVSRHALPLGATGGAEVP